MPDAEALLLINDDEPKVLELDVFLHQAMCPNDDVNGSAGESLDNLPLLSL